MISTLLSLLLLVEPVDTLASAVCSSTTSTTSVPSQVLSGSNLQALSTTTVADALKFFAGVQIKDYGGLGGQKTINVRSLGTQHTGVYIDGVRITNCQNGTVDLGKYSLQNMESVELYNANKTSALMSASEYASGSTVYLTTKRPTSTSGSITYSNGSFNTHKLQLHGSFRKYVFLDVEAQHSDGNYPFSYHSEYEDTTGVRRNSDITLFRAESGVFTDHFRGHIYVYSSERGLPGGIVRRLSDKYGDVGRESDINSFVQGTYQNTWGLHSLKANVRYSYDYLHANSDFPENCFVHYNNHYTQQDLYSSLVYSLNLYYLTISTSPDLRYSNLNCDVFGMKYLYRLDFKDVISLHSSFRGFTADVSCLYTNIKDHSAMKVADRLQRFNPSVVLSYTYSGLTARCFYKSIFRAPTINDLYYTRVGRRDLRPELTNQFDVGLSYVNSYVSAQVDYYHNQVKDKIICIPQGGSYNWKMMNRGYVVTDGVDCSVRASVHGLTLFTTFTYQQVLDLTDPEDDSYGQQLLYSPKWSVSAIASYQYKDFSVSVSHLFCSERSWTYVPGDILPSYNCTDAKVQYFANKHLTLTLECQDLFDVRYELIQRWPLPGRRFMFTLSAKF